MEELKDVLLSMNNGPARFAVHGVLNLTPFPGLHIKGVGPVGLPLCEKQAKEVIAVATKAPYGLGEKTIVNEDYRKTWQIQPDEVEITNHHFQKKVQDIVSQVRQGMACNSNKVKANLYKLLLYEEGCHFKAHRDSEKEEGMFGTLIIQLPSVFKGSHLIVRHGSKTVTVEFDNERSPHEVVYAAHYADCEHEITPLISGYRLALIYNLVWTATSDPPSLDVHLRKERVLMSLLQQIDAEKKSVFGWALEHKYSNNSLGHGVKALKGTDRFVGLALKNANALLDKHSRFTFYIVEIEREVMEQGYSEYGKFGVLVFLGFLFSYFSPKGYTVIVRVFKFWSRFYQIDSMVITLVCPSVCLSIVLKYLRLLISFGPWVYPKGSLVITYVVCPLCASLNISEIAH